MCLRYSQVVFWVAVILYCWPAHGRSNCFSNRPTWETPRPRGEQPDRRNRNRDRGARYETIPKRSERKRLDWGPVKEFPAQDSAFKKLLEHLEHTEGVAVSIIGHQGWGEGLKPLYRFDLPAVKTGKASFNKNLQRPLRVVISSKIHGDETVGKVVVQRLVQRALKDKNFRASFDLTIFPELNVLDRRLAPGLVNLNRTFPPKRTVSTNKEVIQSVEGESYDLFVGLHGAVKDGFFLIRGQEDGDMTRRILGAMESAALLDTPRENHQVGAYELHCLGGAQSKNPGTFKGYMVQQGVPYCYTLEAPRGLTPEQQARGSYKLLLSTLYNVARHGKFPDAN